VGEVGRVMRSSGSMRGKSLVFIGKRMGIAEVEQAARWAASNNMPGIFIDWLSRAI
jgi:hypothetical protein